MSSEDSENYSDAQSGYSVSSDASPVLSDGSNDTPILSDGSNDTPELAARTSIFLRSESMYLALLFALIALLLPAFFFFASQPSTDKEPNDSVEARTSPLTALYPYIPAVSTLFRFSSSVSYSLLRPFIAGLSLFLAVLAPLFLAANILFKALVILPSRTVTGLVQFFYPVYLFCGTACIFGMVVGLGGKLLIEGGRLLLVGTREDTSAQPGKRRPR
ncbi:hypothetical protein JB92DRAFT_1656603 [Gautieria morchelliformis]|nr:hypothetical protein JB92DRAFT_1656603 [Gautieria morchelliformis]